MADFLVDELGIGSPPDGGESLIASRRKQCHQKQRQRRAANVTLAQMCLSRNGTGRSAQEAIMQAAMAVFDGRAADHEDKHAAGTTPIMSVEDWVARKEQLHQQLAQTTVSTS